MALPSTMRASVIESYGGPNKFRIREMPVPRVRANQVLIRIDTAGVGTWDIYFRNGAIKSDRDFPLERTADAHRLVERGHLLGRIVLRP